MRMMGMINPDKSKKRRPDKERLSCIETKQYCYFSSNIFPVFFSPADSNR
jgi:hypothetical protein